MPPIKASYTWTEKTDQLNLSIPLKGVSPKKVDIFVSGKFLKINFAPYLLDIVLHDSVDSLRHKAAVKEGILHISLFKQIPGIWGRCEVDVDKQTLHSIKQEALKAGSQLEEQISSQRSDRRVDDEKVTLRRQMALDEEKRSRLENMQLEEKKEAEKEVYETLSKLQSSTIQPSAAKPGPAEHPAHTEAVLGDNTSLERNADLFDEDDIEEEEEVPSLSSSAQKAPPAVETADDLDEEIKYFPPPRSVGGQSAAKVAISFTPRVFPTPMRESKLAEEEDWIAKNRQHLKKHGVLGKNLQGSGKDISEEDPAWLKAKGDDFFRAGDVQSALNAYSAAIDGDANFTACYANRAACYLKLGLFAQCKADCDRVVEQSIAAVGQLVDGGVETAKQVIALVKAFCRRGAALCQMGQFPDSLADYCQALAKFQQLPPPAISAVSSTISATAIQSDIDRLKLLCDVDRLKKEGDKLFGEGSLTEAVERYTEALQLLPIHVPSLSNRSAVRLALGQVNAAIEDCEQAVQFLQTEEGRRLVGGGSNHQDTAHGMLTAILPPPGSAKRMEWLRKTLARMAVALVQAKRFGEALTAYEQAIALDPKDEKMMADMKLLQARMAAQETTAEVQQQSQDS